LIPALTLLAGVDETTIGSGLPRPPIFTGWLT